MIFCEFVKKRLGHCQARLIGIQKISCMSVFLITDAICDALELDADCDEFDDLKKELCFRLRDGTSLIKPGIRSSFECLKKLMLKIGEEKTTEQSKRKFQRTNMIQAPTNTLTSSTSSTSLIQANTTQTSSRSSSELSLDNHKQYLLNLMEKWCQLNKENLSMNDFDLIDGVDFHLNLVNNNNEIDANVVCICEVMTKLAKKKRTNYNYRIITST
ncbi:unnamed protein product [Didymodactylos carnosus]|uniref:Uncharacterized protein n=1 Tax=Didymodactylos carnosus TaxID=1234261 RepID=A0A815XU48_9BILA|nr:unnamed protein product [Didymodactylos carnosus]CAF1561886.1 unnamed protein product [Didymodactylos carnosus]CAF3687723.1 unnamed protein product [Didymodactylos carnosus]CAF4423482.1 unnamed protein product [Didymodactylos carnosus]